MVDDLLTNAFSSIWVALGVTVLVLLAMTEAGYRVGTRIQAAKGTGYKEQIGAIQGAVLGLLGLLLGFTFAMALQRYDKRRDLVLQEANAIGTTYIRASLLPGAQQAPARDLLRRYVEVRLKYQLLADEAANLAEGMRLSMEIESELWRHATQAAKEAPNDITATFIESLNEMIDTDAERIATGRARIPGEVSLLLLVVAGFGSFTSGYSSGAQGGRTILSGLLMPLLLTAIIVLIFDLAHPLQGLIGISQQPLIELRETMTSPAFQG